MISGGSGGTNSSMTLTGVDGEESAAELAVLDNLRSKMLADDPGELAAFDAFVAQWWGAGGAGMSGGSVGVASEAAAAFAAAPAPVPEPSSAVTVVAGIGLGMSCRRGRRARC